MADTYAKNTQPVGIRQQAIKELNKEHGIRANVWKRNVIELSVMENTLVITYSMNNLIAKIKTKFRSLIISKFCMVHNK